MSNGLLYIAGLIALALAALFAVPYFVDWNGYRGVFEEEASRVLGREVRVGGDVNVRFLPAPFVRFEKLRIADPGGTTGEPFFSADSFTMRLSVPPLLKGVIEANEVELKRPFLRLAVDADGGGNWRSLSIAPGMLPFVPADVTLESVKIQDGMVALQGPKGTGFAQIDGLNGEFKADSIEGPFSFKGTAQWHGAEREVRIATAAADAEGAIRFKSLVRGIAHGDTYTVDGRIADLKGHPRIDGDVAAKLELDAAQLPQAQSANAAKPENPLLDFKARLVGNSKGVKLDDMTLSFERVGPPQLITGAASASWSDALTVELDLASHWLDFDRIAGSTDKSPFDVARSFVSAIMEALPKEAETKVRIALDQANLGGEAVSAIRLELARANGVLQLRDLRAALPGGAKLSFDGTVAEASNSPSFQGELALRGTSLGRFLLWITKDQAVADAVRSDGAFSLQGRLGLSDRSIDLTDAGAEIAGTPLTGEVHYLSGDRARLAIVLEGQEIDGAQLWPAGVGYLKGLLMGPEPAGESKDVAPARRPWLDVATSDLSLRLRAAKVATGRQPLRDVDLDVAIEQGRLSMRKCKFANDDGLALELEGNIAGIEGKPRGSLRWVFAAPNKDAFSGIVRLLDLPEDAAARAMGYVGLAPMRLAGSISVGERAEGAFDISVDGGIQGGRVVADARLDGGLRGWRDAGADLAVTVESADVVQAFDALATRSSSAPPAPRQRAGEIFFKGLGKPSAGLLATATVKGPGLYFAYDGRVELPGEGKQKFDGEVRVSARDLGDVMAMAGLGGAGVVPDTPVIGTVKMVSADHAIELKPQKLTIGASKVDGSIALAYPTGGPAIVTAQLEVDTASIPGLLGVVLDHKVSPDAVAAEPVAQGKSIWPESGFDFAALDGIEGKLGVGFASLTLEPGMAIRNARLEVTLAPGKIAVTKLEGSALGGKLVASLALDRAPGGANLTGDIHLTDAQLVASASGATPAQDAAASLTLEFSGRGSTPGGLIAVAMGKGELALGDMAMRVPTPLAVVATSEAVLTGQAGGSGEALVAALRAQMALSEVKVGPRKIAIDIADGAAKLAPFELASPAGATKVVTTVDLASLTVDSAWLLEPKAPDVEQADRPRKGALPAVNAVYVGPLSNAWTLEPTITADQLERELAIRRLELDAEQLERLHKLDAERARQEDEQRKALEAERARAAAAPAGSLQGQAPGSLQGPQAPPGGAQGGVPAPGPAQQGSPQQAFPQQGPPQQAPPPSQGALSPDPFATPPGDETGAAIVPAVPGLEAQAVPPQPGDPAAGALPAGVLPPGAVAAPTAPQDFRPKRPRRQVPAGEQVQRALQNNTN